MNISLEKVDVSIIIVSYNTRDLTLQCLNSIFEKTKNIEIEVIVVDNNSTDGSQQELKERFPQIRLIESTENLGFGRANNCGIKFAKGKYLFLLNSDSILLNNAVKIFFDFMEENHLIPIGAAGSVLLDENKEITHSSGPFPSKWEEVRSAFVGYFYKKDHLKQRRKEYDQYKNLKTFLEVDYVTGADLFISRVMMEKFDGFDPNFFMYFEESDLQLRMKGQGYKNVILKGPEIIHFQGASDINPGFSVAKRILNARSTFYYFKKRSGGLGYCLFRMTFFIVKLPLLFDTRVTLSDRFRYMSFLLLE